MSCFIMNPDSIRKIGYTLAAILGACKYNHFVTFDKSAATAAKLDKVFADCTNGIYHDFDPEMISEVLHRLNARAYAGRYRDPELEPFAAPNRSTRYTLRPAAGACNTPQEWHYHLCSLLDCYLYQTAEDATQADPLREALSTFAAGLKSGIVQHSDIYNKFRWGE